MRRTAADAVRVLRVLGARVLEAALVVLALASLVFFALRLLPGDPARLVLGDAASPADLARVRATLHLDQSLGAQYARFLRGLATLDLGDSFRRPGTPAMARVAEALAPTAQLAALAVAMGAILGVAAGVAASGPWLAPRTRASIERALAGVAAAPLVAFAPVVTWALAARLRIVPLPGDPDAGFAGLAFASALLAIPLAAHVGRIARAALAEIARAPFLLVASAKGAGAFRVWIVHALPPVAGPIVTVVASQLGALLGGAVVLERMFERRGLGTLILEAYASRDLPVLEGSVVAAGLLFVGAQAAGTALHVALDPRVRDAP
ncbi:MAG TPA: ABC transporter permease [Polyangiaceae bacterium]|jgi:peptide/nickel transport system permease protein|nr:ABC transporter permease [Polyangiaceae bacterium]